MQHEAPIRSTPHHTTHPVHCPLRLGLRSCGFGVCCCAGPSTYLQEAGNAGLGGNGIYPPCFLPGVPTGPLTVRQQASGPALHASCVWPSLNPTHPRHTVEGCIPPFPQARHTGTSLSLPAHQRRPSFSSPPPPPVLPGRTPARPGPAAGCRAHRPPSGAGRDIYTAGGRSHPHRRAPCPVASHASTVTAPATHRQDIWRPYSSPSSTICRKW